MCLALQYGKTINNAIENIKQDLSDLSKLMSNYDKKVNEIYHQIETSNLNASDGYKKYKELQRTLRERRIVKNELYRLDQLTRAFNIDKVYERLDNKIKNTKKFEDGHMEYIDGWNISIEDIMVRS